MKLLFVHETKFKEDEEGNLYTGGSYNKEVWDRYLFVSSDFSVIARKEEMIYKTDYSKKRFNYFDKDKINFVEVPSLFSSIGDFLEIDKHKKVNEIIKNEILKADYLIARLPSVYGYIAVKFAKKFKKPYLIEVVGCAWDSLWNHSFKGKLFAFHSYRTMRKLLIDSPYVIYVTNDFLQKRYPSEGKVANCSNVLITEFDEVILSNRLIKIRNVNEDSKLIIGTIGGVDIKYKGQQYVIQALGKLKNDGYTNFEYQLVGGGEQSFLRRVAERYGVTQQIKFLGSMPRDKVIDWIDNIDIYIQPSITEGLPRALIEAMSRGCPAFGASSGGIPELLDSEVVFKAKSVDSLYCLLKATDRELMEKHAKRNFGESKKYNKEIIESRRKKFLVEFIQNT